MKYAILRNKSVGDKDLEMNTTYKKRRLFEIQQKELEETLSNHLVNYHSLTHSNSFDTSDGDQWEFSITAKIKPRKKRKED